MPIHIKGSGGGQAFDGAIGITETYTGAYEDQPDVSINATYERLRITSSEVEGTYGREKIVGVQNFSFTCGYTDDESGFILSVFRRSDSRAYYMYMHWYGAANLEDAEEQWLYEGTCDYAYNSANGMLDITGCEYFQYADYYDNSIVNVTWSVDLSK